MAFAIDTGVKLGQGSLVRHIVGDGTGRLASQRVANEEDHPAASRIMPELAIRLAADCARQMACSRARRNEKAEDRVVSAAKDAPMRG
jgi:hypothetical protein